METLRSLLNSDTISRVEILRMPDTMMTRVNVSPQALRSSSSYTVIFKQNLKATFGGLLAGISAKSESRSPDLRWGVILYDARDHELGTIFVDRSGQYGYVNNGVVEFTTGTFDSSLAKRLHKILAGLG
jgi:hypothetical protein